MKPIFITHMWFIISVCSHGPANRLLNGEKNKLFLWIERRTVAQIHEKVGWKKKKKDGMIDS